MIDIGLIINVYRKSSLREDLDKEITDNWEFGILYELYEQVNTTRGIFSWDLHYRQMMKNRSPS
jgi:hypothetical protein